MAYKTLNLDLAKSPILKSIVYGRIGDSDMQTVTVNITSRDTPVNLTGYIITFEGITNGEKTKVFDVDGINSTDEGLKKGTFDYTFPNMAFAVGGSYEIAYFSIVKGDKRDTTGEFDIIVGSNADIDAAEAETIITEYNKLVKDLHAITDKYISDSDAKFADINSKIVDLQAKITQYQTTVKNTAENAVLTVNTAKDSAISAVSTSANNAIQAVEAALKQFEAGNFYTKEVSDSRFAPIKTVQDLAALSQTVGTKANDSEVVHLTGDETIEGTKDFTGKLKTSGNSVYGVTINSGWYEEKLGDNFYRWTQVFTVTTAINQGAGSALQQSGTLTIPTPPTNISITSRFVQAGQAPWSCWAMYFPGANAFRLFSFAARESGEATIEAVLYGSKS